MLPASLHAIPNAAQATRAATGVLESTERARYAATTATRPDGAPAANPDPLTPAVINHVQNARTEPGERPTAPTSRPASAAADSGETSTSEKKVTDKKAAPHEIDEAEAEQIRKLQARDAAVRAHEQAHATAGGGFAGAPSYVYQRGPDGRNYAIGGEVPIDVSAVAGDPEATILKMQQVQRAALAPADPSGADRAIAATASAMIQAARVEQTKTDTQTGADSGRTARETFSAHERRAIATSAYTQTNAERGTLSLVT